MGVFLRNFILNLIINYIFFYFDCELVIICLLVFEKLLLENVKLL